jgi:hypothetical protein
MRPIEQVELFEGYYDWLEDAADKLHDFPERVTEILSSNPNTTEHRISTVSNHVRQNIDLLLRTIR